MHHEGLVVAYTWNREKQMFVALGKEFDMIYTLISESREHSSQCCGLALFLKMGHLQKCTSKIVNCLMQSGQSPKQYFLKHHEPLDMVL